MSMMSQRSPLYSRLMMLSPNQNPKQQTSNCYFETPSTFIEQMTAPMAIEPEFPLPDLDVDEQCSISSCHDGDGEAAQ